MSLCNVGFKPRISPLAEMEGDFLERNLPLRAFATLTTLTMAPRHQLDASLHQWIRDLQKHHRATIGFIRSVETTPQNHIHVALVAAVPLDCQYAESLWQHMAAPRYKEAAVVKPYQHGLCGLAYVLKELGGPFEDIQFSNNLLAFAAGSGKSRFPTTSAQRRQTRRIKEQIMGVDAKASSLQTCLVEGYS